MTDITHDRYAGIGGSYVVVDGERFPADHENGYAPLPHTRNEDGTPVQPEPAPEPDPQE
jgi:hypothetical protein